jgi:sugar O-acyltransferase (sialic acid O-acetyltransferase NeuD family)
MKRKIPLIIIGAGETARIAYEYFTYDSSFRVVGFAVEKKFLLKEKTLFRLPIIQLETLKKTHPPKKFRTFVALSYTKLNRVRTRLFEKVTGLGYTCATYVSSRAFVWRTAKIGTNCFILENNVIQHRVLVGDNVILWSGNHIGHQTIIENNVFISSHCVISGFCRIGAYSFLGVNSSYNDHVNVAPDTVVGSGAVVIKDTEKGRVYVGNPAKPLDKSSYDVL